MTTQEKTFNTNIQILNNLGFNANKSLSILKRLNSHVERCVENNQNYEETLFYVSQDFTFDNNTMENLLVNAIISEDRYEKYYK